MDTSRGGGIPPRLIIGLAILAIGAFLVFENMGIIHADIHWGELWPLVLIVIGLSHLLQPRRHRGGFVLLFVGCWFLAHNLFDFDLDFRYFFPVLLLIVGGLLVWGASSRGLRRTGTPDGVPDSSADLHSFAVLGAAHAASNALAFLGGSATAVLGSCTLDLREAGIAPGQEALIDAVACWGGVLILVPESWSVALKGAPILGGFHDYTRPPAGASTQRLVVRGVAFMGGVEVRNRPESEDPR